MFANRIIFALCLMASVVLTAGADSAVLDNEPKKPARRSSAWTLAFPLGEHLPSTFDTLTYNYQRNAIPSMTTDAYATTGNMGAEGLDMIYFNRRKESAFMFDRSLSRWLSEFDKEKFYDVFTPMTLLSYNFGGNRDNHLDRLQATFAGNVNRRIGIGASLDYLYSKGAYNAQATKDFSFGFSGYYTGDRYEMQAFFNHFNLLNKENGGITDPLYITDPAELQGGYDHIQAKSIPVRLTAAHTRLVGAEFFMSHALKVGFWRQEQVNDTLVRDIYVPVTRFIYSLDYQSRHHLFLNTDATQGREFWSDFYLNPSATRDDTYYWDLTNSLGVEMIEGFNKWARFGLSAYASFAVRNYRQVTDSYAPELTEEQIAELSPLPDWFGVLPHTRQGLLWVGGRLKKEQGSILRYYADARFGIAGDVAGDIEADGKVETRFRMLGDTVSISADAHFSNLRPSFLIRKYISNHFAWDNDFGQTRRFRVGGSLVIPWTRTTLSAGVENVQNMVYFDPSSLPVQYGGSVQVFAARLDQRLRFGIWNWDNTLTYQTSSRQDLLPLPAFTLYSNMYLNFKAFRVLDLQVGVDCDYYTSYKGYIYQPATMTFRVQGDDAVSVGNFPFANLYVTAKLYKVRFYVMWSHFNQGLFTKSYFSMPCYPVNPRNLQFGLSVDFAD
ncbi:MAG: putative porin [Bacteroidales bacterium]|nr:putative porin [Bacteroidales bacterium]